MTEKRKMNDFRMNNLAYIQAGDYYIPDIRLQPIEEKELGKYGRMRRVFLQEYKPMLFDDLVLTEQLFPHLYEVQETTKARVERIMEGLLEKNPALEKEKDAMAWVRHMNMLKAQAEEVVMTELIYI